MIDSIDKPGVYALSEDDYHADPVAVPSASASILATLLHHSARHAWWEHPRLNSALKREEKVIFDLGGAAHEVMLCGPSTVSVIDAGDWRTKAAKDARDAARAEGRIPLLPPQWNAVREMVANGRAQIAAHQECPHALDPSLGKAEQTLIWQEEGVWCRIRADWTPDDHHALYDYKTTGASAEPDAWARAHLWPRNAIQAALYRRGARALLGVPDVPFRFIVQENEQPYALSIVQLGPAAMDLADRQVTAALKLWRQCLQTDRWPGYPARICHVDAPTWETNRWDSREAREKFIFEEGESPLDVALHWQAPIGWKEKAA